MRAVQSEVGMQIEFLLEERSAEVALKLIIPKILSNDVGRDFHSFQGQQDLLGTTTYAIERLQVTDYQ